MKRRTLALTCSLVAALTTACSNGPAVYTHGKPYTATYERVAAGRHLQFTVASDGLGHVRFDGNGAPVHGMNDYTDGKHYEFSEKQKKFYARPLMNDDTCMDESTIKTGSSTSVLGERNLSGHECRGYSPNGKSSGGGKLSEVWFDKETGALIGETSADMQINLLEFKAAPPPPTLFTFPPDWQMSTSPVN
jgi:hypothetical protein